MTEEQELQKEIAIELHSNLALEEPLDEVVDYVGDYIIPILKQHCYLKAEKELPKLTFGWNEYNIIGNKVQQDMLKEVDGVSFKACRELS